MTLVPIDAAAAGMFVAFLLGALTASLGRKKERSGFEYPERSKSR